HEAPTEGRLLSVLGRCRGSTRLHLRGGVYLATALSVLHSGGSTSPPATFTKQSLHLAIRCGASPATTQTHRGPTRIRHRRHPRYRVGHHGAAEIGRLGSVGHLPPTERFLAG